MTRVLVAGVVLAVCLLAVFASAPMASAAEAVDRPNILWVTCEDISPDLGCYGVKHAVTPTLDRLAAEGIRYDNAFALAGVCAISRSCLITGMYSSSLGSQGMRSQTRLPDNIHCFTEYLRSAGYYCTNNSKTDYNFPTPKAAWDECSRKAHWRGREAGQPFFAVFNFVTTHESQIRCSEEQYERHMRRVAKELRHDPATTPIPPFHPDLPEVHRDWARYHDLITAMDLQVRDVLTQLEEDGLADSTIVFFYGDHGAGMPRCKKWSYDTGTRVPLLLRFPKKYASLAPGEPGSATDRLVSFVDFGPTVLSLAGVKLPPHVQGIPFLGEQAGEPRTYVYNLRDRMAERFDMVRGVHDKQFLYLRNYRPDLAFGRHASYTQEMPTTRLWMQLAAEGKLTGPPALWFRKTKPIEELYDTLADPYTIHDLAGDPKYADVLKRLRAEHDRWTLETRDLGYLPEYDMLTRSEGSTPYEMGHDDAKYPLERIRGLASLIECGDEHLPAFTAALSDTDPAMRFWGTVGVASLGEKGLASEAKLAELLKDDSPVVKLAAATALVRIGSNRDVMPTALDGLKHEHEWIRLRATTLLELLGNDARPALPQIREALKMKSQFGYENRLLQILATRLTE